MSAEKICLEDVACPLCQSRKGRQLFTGTDRLHRRDGRFAVSECLTCGFRFTNPRPTRESMVHYYPNDYGPYRGFTPTGVELFADGVSFFSSLKNELKAMVLRRHYAYRLENAPAGNGLLEILPRSFAASLERAACRLFQIRNPRIPLYRDGGMALDIGCGNGHYLLFLKELGWEPAGFDIANNVAAAVTEAGIPIYTGSIDGLKAHAGSFELITMWHALEHLHDPVEDLRSIYRLLADGGKLLIEVPNSDSIAAKLFRSDWFQWDLPRHLSHFTPESLVRLLEIVGFRVNHLTHLHKTTLPDTLRYWFETHKRPGMLGAPHQESRWCRWVRMLGYPLRWCRSGENILVGAAK
jgi:SAM-dependent methyltransferase